MAVSSTTLELPALRGPLATLRGDAPFYLYIAAYAAAVSLAAMTIGATRKMLPLSFYAGAANAIPLLLLLIVAATGLWALMSPRPLEAWRAALARVSGFLPDVLLLVGLGVFICVFSSMKQMLTDIEPFYADMLLADADRILHGADPWELAAAVLPASLTPVVEWAYFWTWGAALLAALVAALFLPSLGAIRRQCIWTFLLMWPLLGNLLAGALMSAGPVFFDKVTGESRFAPLLAYLAKHTDQRWVHEFLWSSYAGLQPGIVGAGISAFPSMHVASATLCALVAAAAGGWVRWVGASYCALILFGSVLLGWHYALDGYVSIVATVAIWCWVGRSGTRSMRWRLRALKQTTPLRARGAGHRN